MIYVPFPDQQSALEAIKTLLDAKLIACGNVIMSSSAYVWQGNLTSQTEWIAIMKTSIVKANHTITKIEEIHSYQVPAILHWEASANEAYALWIDEQIS